MIRTYRDRKVETIAGGKAPKGLPAGLVRPARQKLKYLDAARDLGDLRSPPGNRLEALKAIGLGSTPSASTTSGVSVSAGSTVGGGC